MCLTFSSASGITTPLLVTKTSGPTKGSRADPSSSSKPHVTSAKGKIVSNEHSSRKQAEDFARYGASSRIVLLEGMVGSLAELDDDPDNEDGLGGAEGELASDVGEECGKFGVVDRVVIHRVSPAHRRVSGSHHEDHDPSKAVRIFVVFSGVAGAWTGLKALDGRFFGGRTVRARYFDERKFERGERDD